MMLLLKPLYIGFLTFQKLINLGKDKEWLQEKRNQLEKSNGLKKMLIAAQIQMAQSVASIPVWG